MTDRTDAQTHLDTLARDVASPLPPGLLGTARGARRRRTRGRLAVAGGVAAAAVVAVAVAVPGGRTTPAEAPFASGTADPGSDPTVAPEGTRWISQGTYMAAVPVEWARTVPPCASGDVTDVGPGFYYVTTTPNFCDVESEGSPSAGFVRLDGPAHDLACTPRCSQRVVAADGLQLWVSDLATAEDVEAIIETLQPLPDDWDVDPDTGEAAPAEPSTPAPDPNAEGKVVTDLDDVVGQWVVIEVDGGPVPAYAERGLIVGRTPARLSLTYNDGTNYVTYAAVFGADGTLGERAMVEMTAAACVAPTDVIPSPCDHPSGFGVQDAVQLRLTDDGNLVLVGADGSALAVYRPQA